MKPGNSDKAWKRLGVEDPYWAIKGGDRLKAENLDDIAIKEFFDSGQAHIDQTLGQIRSNLDAAFEPKSALDFGCGVGRMLVPLASMCDRVAGVDVSDAMLKEARVRCGERGLSNVKFVQGNDEMSGVTGSFDFIHSHIVFQHIPRKRGEMIFERLIDLLNEGGVAALHFTYYRQASQFRKTVNWCRRTLPLVNNLVNLLQSNRAGLPFHQMNSYNLNHLFRILRDKGCAHSFVNNLEPSKGFYRMMLYFQKQRVNDRQIAN